MFPSRLDTEYGRLDFTRCGTVLLAPLKTFHIHYFAALILFSAALIAVAVALR